MKQGLAESICSVVDFVSGDSPYGEFAARVRRQGSGSNKDHDWDDSGNPADWEQW